MGLLETFRLPLAGMGWGGGREDDGEEKAKERKRISFRENLISVNI